MDTGFTSQDAQSDFSSARRRAALAKLAGKLRGQAGDVTTLLPFEEVVDALGRVDERYLGTETIPLETIVGSVDRAEEFDSKFRPTTSRLRQRWMRINKAQREGKGMPPIDVYRIGGLHFVSDGHHRVSVARHRDLEVIEARVTEVKTRVKPDEELSVSDLGAKDHERLFLERVPLAPEQRDRIQPTKPEPGYAQLAECVEAWGFRLIQGTGEPLDRAEVAASWFSDEFVPVCEALREAGLATKETDVDAYLRLANQRYLLLRTHEWDEDVIERLQAAVD